MSEFKGFDKAASGYDNLFSFSKIGKAQRNKVHNLVKKSLKEPINFLLEINGGTGEDIELMTSVSKEILFTDQSEEMVNIARSKNKNSKAKFEIMDIKDLETKTFNTEIDCIFSNFGGINCLNPLELQCFFENISKKLSKSGKVILVIMPRNCIWERLFFTLKGEKNKALRRLRKEASIAVLNGIKIPTWYYSPKEIKKMSKLYFDCKEIKPIGLFIPPSYLEKTILTRAGIFPILMGLERLLNWNVFANNADHFYIELELKNE